MRDCKRRNTSKLVLRGANNELYGDLKIELENDYAKGVDNNPASVNEAVALLNAYHWKNTEIENHVLNMTPGGICTKRKK